MLPSAKRSELRGQPYKAPSLGKAHQQEPSQELGWRYDIGDNWAHSITLVEALPEAESTGAAQLLDGSGACPPEDSCGLEGMGCCAYQARKHGSLVLAAHAGGWPQLRPLVVKPLLRAAPQQQLVSAPLPSLPTVAFDHLTLHIALHSLRAVHAAHAAHARRSCWTSSSSRAPGAAPTGARHSARPLPP